MGAGDLAYYEGDDSVQAIRGTYVDDTLYLYGGNDAADGSFGTDWIYGGEGNDRLFGGYQDDYLFGEAGNDRLRGDGGDDQLEGGAGGDILDGGTGNDRFVFGGVADMRRDRVYGGTGTDTLVLDLTTVSAIRFGARDSIEVVSFGGMSFRDIERYEIVGGSRADILTGWLLDDDLDGNGGNDRIAGYFGADMIDGGDGNDNLLGGGDNDFVYGDEGNDLVRGGFGRDNLEGGSGNDRLYGEWGNDDIDGNTGSDLLSGGDGNDTLNADAYLDAGNERDALNGGAGHDLLRIGMADVANGQTGTDEIEAHFAESTRNESYVLRQAAYAFANGARISGFEILDYVGGSGVDRITAGRFNDNLEGGGGNDRLNGLGGNDTLDGDDGNDLLVGGTGNDYLVHASGNDRLLGQAGADTFSIQWDEIGDFPYRTVVNGGAGRDVVDFSSITLGAVVDLSIQARNAGLAYGKTFTAVEALRGTSIDDSFAGTARADSFFGNSGDDVLSGRAGNDRLVGGDGSDMLTGGAGADTFDFTDYASGWLGDTITDFTRRQDTLAFNFADLGYGSAAGVRLVSGNGPSPVGGGPNLLFDNATDRLWYDEDGANSTYGPVLLATLTGVNGLAESDFAFS